MKKPFAVAAALTVSATMMLSGCAGADKVANGLPQDPAEAAKLAHEMAALNVVSAVLEAQPDGPDAVFLPSEQVMKEGFDPFNDKEIKSFLDEAGITGWSQGADYRLTGDRRGICIKVDFGYTVDEESEKTLPPLYYGMRITKDNTIREMTGAPSKARSPLCTRLYKD